jgi:hypothetical protein
LTALKQWILGLALFLKKHLKKRLNPNIKIMKNKLLITGQIVLMLHAALGVFGQTVTEAVTPLTKKAQKGFVNELIMADNGNVNVVYKIGGDKKKKELFFESYEFGKDLKFLGTKSANEPKVESKPDVEMTGIYAYVGGFTSFDVLSMKLKVNIRKANYEWDYKNQRYVVQKVISSEVIKLKSASDRNYMGIEKYGNDNLVLAYYENADEERSKQYVFLAIDTDGGVKETKLDAVGNYSMVYSQAISEETRGTSVGEDDFVVILAPRRGFGDPTKYIYLHYDMTGQLKNKVEFVSPSSNLLVNSIDVKNGEVYLVGLSTKSKEAYQESFADYSIIESPGFQGEGNNQFAKYNSRAAREMDNFHLLKFSGNKMIFATTAPIDEFKAKKKTAPGDKGGKIYKGSKFNVMSFKVTPSNEFLIAGQLMSRNTIGKVYGDLVCFHFDAQGKLRAQYAVDKVFEDKASEIFGMPQSFNLTADGKYAYWEILEVKGFKGYASFVDAYNGNATFYPRFFPRISKIDLQAASLSEFKIPGDKKYFINVDNGMSFNPVTHEALYVGCDKDFENLWVSKVVFD